MYTLPLYSTAAFFLISLALGISINSNINKYDPKGTIKRGRINRKWTAAQHKRKYREKYAAKSAFVPTFAIPVIKPFRFTQLLQSLLMSNL
jgi:hypothetical protein